MMASSWFEKLEVAPPIEVFELTSAFNEDTHPQKVNLGVGAYRTDDSKPYVLPVVRQVETQLAQDTNATHEYLPIAGLPAYRTGSIQLLLGAGNPALERADGIQAIGGTGAVRIGLDLLRSNLGIDTVYVSKPTWGNHKGIAKSLLYPNIKEYRYWDQTKRCIDFENMLTDLRNAPERSAVLLHMCAHNPTGMDPSMEQWKQIATVFKEKHLFPFFDCAYQGFSSGDVDKDAESLRYFVSEGFEVLAAQSYSKNFGLYNERVGQLTFVANNRELLNKIRSQLVLIVRETWSNPPTHGAKIVATVLNNPDLLKEWKETVRSMAERIQLMRKLLFDKLKENGAPGTWDHVVQQSGMFSYTGLSSQQAEYLIKEFHIYLTKDGRINMCAITTKNAEYVAKAIHDAIVNIKA